MKLFEVTNGYVGESYVKVFVIANNEATAKRLAKEVYKQDRPNAEHYYDNLDVSVLCDNTSTQWTSDVRDC